MGEFWNEIHSEIVAYSILNGDLFKNGKKGKEKKKGIKRTKCFFLYPLEKYRFYPH